MTIVPALSRKLYETFGDETAEAMVAWMDRMDAGRVELRELNELNVARFEARLDARIAEVGGKIDARFGDLMKWSIVFWCGSTVTLVVALATLGRLTR